MSAHWDDINFYIILDKWRNTGQDILFLILYITRKSLNWFWW